MKCLKSLLAFVPLFMCGIFAVSGLANIAQAAQRVMVATQCAKDHPTTAALYEFKDRIEKETDGGIKIRVFPANQLGDYTQVYEELRRGTIDMGLISVPSQFDPRLEVIYLHYLARSYEEARRIYARGSALFKEVQRLHAELGVQFLSFNFEGFGGLALKRLPRDLDHPDRPKGLVVRVPPMGVFKVTAEDQGFETVTVPYVELREALKTGVIEGSIGGPPAATYLQFREFFTYFVANHNFFESTSYLMSKELWDSLSAEDQRLIEDIIADLSEKSFTVAEASDREYLARMPDAGMEVITLSKQEIEQWAAHTRRVTWPKLSARLGEGLIARLTVDDADTEPDQPAGSADGENDSTRRQSP